MATTSLRFVVGARGRRQAVLLDIAEYRRLMKKLEDLEDALALDRAEQTSNRLLPYAAVRKRLKRSGKL
ncbi:MAG: type II toxin-antitoxin system prevent-host-death family antitoxin [Acidobacteriia bacterium]|nr:type II toxin-antitoxin system prevent-host-death family antitoxin [Terriglobia bacterium]